MDRKLEITPKAIAFTFFFIILLYLLYLVREVLVGLFLALILTAALGPYVSKLTNFKIPRPLSILLLYILIIFIISLLISAIIPPLLDQSRTLVKALPIDQISSRFSDLEVNLESVQLVANQLGSITPIIQLVGSTFSGIVATFTLAIVTYYLLMERNHLHKHLSGLFSKNEPEKAAEKFLNSIESEIGGWVRGETILMLVVGLLTYIGLRLLNIQYALPLAIIAGFFELIPNIGPIVSSFPAIIVPLITGMPPVTSVFVAALYIFIQQLENNLIVPKVMEKSAGVHPLVTIIAIICGLKLAGITGAVLSVPFFLVARVVYKQVIKPHLHQS